MRLWQIRWADHNPSPCCTVVLPSPGEWVPLALPVDLTPRTERSLDYLLLEIVVEGLEEGEQLQLSDVAVWACDQPG
jgi:hypothetical protein